MAIQVGGGDNDFYSTTSVLPASSSIWTAMCWVKFADTTYSAFLGLGPSSTGVFYEFAAAEGGGTLDYWNGTTNVQGGTITTGTWYHAALVGNGTDVKVYLDGALVGTGSLNGGITIGQVEFGGVGFGGEGHRGAVAQCRLFDAALTAGEIATEAASSHAVASNCIGDWPMHMPGFGLYNISATDVGFSGQLPANTYNLVVNAAQGTLTAGPSQSVFDFLQGGPTGRNTSGTSDPVVSALTGVLSGSLLIAGGATYQAGGTATVGASAVADGTNTWVRAEEITQGGDPIAVAAYYALAAATGNPDVTLTPSSGRWSIVAAAEFKQPAAVVVETPVEGQSLASPQDLTGGTPSGANNISILAATWYDDGRPAVTGWTPLALHPNFNNAGGSQTLGLWFRIQSSAAAPSASIRYYTGTIGNAAVLFTISEDAGADTTLTLTASGSGIASAALTTEITMGAAASGSGLASMALGAAAEFALSAIGAGSLSAALADEEYPHAFLRIDDDNSVFIDLPSMPAIGDTIFVMMDAWQWTTPPAGEGVDPQSSWLTDNNGASAGDYQREAIVLATDGRAQASINTPGVAIFRRVVTSVSNSPYRITATGGFDWGGIALLAVPGAIDAPPQAWAKDWRPTATIGGIPPDITFGTIANTTDYAIQIGAAHNSGHGNGIDGPGEGTVYPPRQTGTSGYVVIGMEGHNSLHLSFHAWYRVVHAIETLTPLMLLEDLDGATFTACRGVQAVYGLVGGEGGEAVAALETLIAMALDGSGRLSGQAAADTAITLSMAAVGELIANPNLQTVMPRVYAMITGAAVRQGRVIGTVTIRKIGGTLEVLP